MTERTVLVTGGNRGIGRSIAEEFVRQGHRVAVTVRSGEGPAGTLSVKADVTDPASLDAAFAEIEEKLGPVEILVANAGITRDTLLMRMTDEQFEEVVDTNLNGVFRVVRRASVGMIKKKFGRVILIGSVVGLLGSAGQINYSSTKAALVGMARSITRELGARNITANVIAPWLHRHRYDRRTCRRTAGRVQKENSGWQICISRRSRQSCRLDGI
jgi:3-oxoacyl-[acyl-carrier protein] reductase